MKRSDFENSPSGRLVPTLNRQFAFVPAPLPPELDMAALAMPLADAAEAIGELNGVGADLSNPYLLITPLQRREAVSSSNIEGTYSSISELLMLEVAGVGESKNADTREVWNYVRALEAAVEDLQTLPLCLRVLRNAHSVLLQGVPKNRVAYIVPGEFKREQNWIGGSARDIEKARFVPPPPAEAADCLDKLEKYIQREDVRCPHPLIDAGLIHYQFEAIHPFPDGNGRVGRMLITLFMCAREIQRLPLLYMSQFFEDNKDEYIDRMFMVSKAGDWTNWLLFFLEGVRFCAKETVSLIRSLLALKKDFEQRAKVAGKSALLLRAIDVIFEYPVLTIPELAKRLEVTYRAAQSHIERCRELDLLEELVNTANPKFFYAPKVLKLLGT